MTDQGYTENGPSPTWGDRVQLIPQPKGARVVAFDTEGNEVSTADVQLRPPQHADITLIEAQHQLDVELDWSVDDPAQMTLTGEANGAPFTFSVSVRDPNATPDAELAALIVGDAEATEYGPLHDIPGIQSADSRLLAKWRSLTPALRSEVDKGGVTFGSLLCYTCVAMILTALVEGPAAIVVSTEYAIGRCGGACA